MAKQKIGFTT